MALDEALLEAAPESSEPILRFYGWSAAAATFGYFQKSSDASAGTELRPLIRRPTGGGLVPHSHDWTYSLVFPTSHEWYRLSARASYCRVHDWVAAAFQELGVLAALSTAAEGGIPGRCFIGAEEADVVLNGQKIAGAAQRRSRNGLLIQGSIQPPEAAGERSAWEIVFCKLATSRWNVLWRPYEITGSILARARSLEVEKYSQAAYNERR